jgi:hypothetical protein
MKKNKIKIDTDVDTFRALVANCLLFHKDVTSEQNYDHMELSNASIAFDWAFSNLDGTIVSPDTKHVTLKLDMAQACAICVVLFMYNTGHALWLVLYNELTEKIDKQIKSNQLIINSPLLLT